ncbi:MFS transporter [Nonomuraea sp. NN258]|uniref:MFS transporter n=1 Tax=Nonomuraea antri TaxID=2730852 RepID=UPI0015698EE2|nr:MFS transporter [Nonomuraea antri]NRQ33186.1 MFS transporter [Nonomuraea antri]
MAATRLLGVGLAPGYTRTNLLACWLVCLTATMGITFLPTALPFVLSDVLGIPEAQRGLVTGLLTVTHELTMIASLAWYGALADRFGRRPIVLAGFVLCGLGVAVIPFAGSTEVLVVLRVLFSLGAAALGGMFATLAVDYVQDRSRGKSYGMLGVFGGLGGLAAVFGLARLPDAFERTGMTPVAAARWSFLVVAAGLIVIGWAMWAALSPLKTVAHVPLSRLVREGVALARDPGVALSYAAALVARADLAVVSSFLSLWIINAAKDAGMTGPQALARAGMIVGIAHTVALLAAPLFGWLGDRIARQNLVIGCQVVAALAYLSTLLIADPLGPGMYLVAVFAGLGEIAGITTAGPLLAQQVPAARRGSAFGVQALCGALGILIVSAVGGLLFDSWRPAAPFVVSAGLGLCVVAFGLAVRKRVRPHPEADLTPVAQLA